MNTTSESEKNRAAADVSPKAKRAATKKARPTKKAVPAKRPTTSRPTAGRANKKAEVIAMMKCAKGVTLAVIMKATGWQPHTVRASSAPGQQGWVQIESSKDAAGERAYKIAK
jgi:hypothetical protein